MTTRSRSRARLGLEVILHPRNRGYGANQKTCYREALAAGADIVVMVHPDYQYEPRLVPAMAGDDRVRRLRRRDRLAHPRRRRARGRHAAVQVRGESRADGVREHAARREAVRVPHRLSRVLARRCSRRSPWPANSDDFVFDNQMLAQAIVGRLPDRRDLGADALFPEASSINFRRAVRYGLGVVGDDAARFPRADRPLSAPAVRRPRARMTPRPLLPVRKFLRRPAPGGGGLLHWLHSFALHVVTGFLAVAAHYSVNVRFRPRRRCRRAGERHRLRRRRAHPFRAVVLARVLALARGEGRECPLRLVIAVQLVANSALLAGLLELGMSLWPAQVATTIALTFANYLAYRLWVFR